MHFPLPLWVKSRHQRTSASCPLYPQKRTWISTARDVCFETHAAQQIWRDSTHRPAGTSSVDDKIKTGRTFRLADQSIRWGEGVRNFDANLAIVADGTRMEREECVLVDVLREGFRRRRNGLHETIVIDIDCLHELIDQFVWQIVPANRSCPGTYKLREPICEIVNSGMALRVVSICSGVRPIAKYIARL